MDEDELYNSNVEAFRKDEYPMLKGECLVFSSKAVANIIF